MVDNIKTLRFFLSIMHAPTSEKKLLSKFGWFSFSGLEDMDIKPFWGRNAAHFNQKCLPTDFHSYYNLLYQITVLYLNLVDSYDILYVFA